MQGIYRQFLRKLQASRFMYHVHFSHQLPQHCCRRCLLVHYVTLITIALPAHQISEYPGRLQRGPVEGHGCLRLFWESAQTKVHRMDITGADYRTGLQRQSYRKGLQRHGIQGQKTSTEKSGDNNFNMNNYPLSAKMCPGKVIAPLHKPVDFYRASSIVNIAA